MEIYYFSTCDAWRSYDGMCLCFIGTSKQKLKMYISGRIENGDVEYTNTELSAKQQAENFRKDFNEKSLYGVNSLLTYGNIGVTVNNEEI